jgi:hypothetical protein
MPEKSVFGGYIGMGVVEGQGQPIYLPNTGLRTLSLLYNGLPTYSNNY